MPTIYTRWMLGFCHRLVNNLSKMCPFADFNQPKLYICPNLQKKHCIGKQNFAMLMELLNIARYIRQMEFGDLSQIWK